MSADMRLIIVSGLSGSGKTVALHVLEDLGYYCVDNMPAALLKAVIEEVTTGSGGCQPDGAKEKVYTSRLTLDEDSQLQVASAMQIKTHNASAVLPTMSASTSFRRQTSQGIGG